jgi:aryl-alcohol dehydrogenase-like predicted oxidoreductase
MLPTRPLGKTGVPVTVLGFGRAPFGDLYERLDEGNAIACVEAAHRAGMTLFDTSPHYGNGLVLAHAFEPCWHVLISRFEGTTLAQFHRLESARDRPSLV